MDQINRRFLTDILSVMVILLFTIAAYLRYPVAGVLFAGSLALTIFVAADIVLFRRG